MTTLQAERTSRVAVDILDETYTIRGDADPGYIAEVARLVDHRLRDLRTTHRNIPKTRLAVLVAINLADELLQLKAAEQGGEQYDAIASDELERRTLQLITLLDEGLTGGL